MRPGSTSRALPSMTRSAAAGEIAPEKEDAVVLEGEVDAAAVNLPAQPFVPGDHPGGVFDQSRSHLAHSRPESPIDRDCFASLAMTMKVASSRGTREDAANLAAIEASFGDMAWPSRARAI